MGKVLDKLTKETPWYIKLLRKMLAWCPQCHGYLVFPRKRRMNTQYEKEESNFCTVCKRCFLEIEAHWEERWDEYNSGRY